MNSSNVQAQLPSAVYSTSSQEEHTLRYGNQHSATLPKFTQSFPGGTRVITPQLPDERSETLQFSSPLEAEFYLTLRSLPSLEKDKHGQYQYTKPWLEMAIDRGLPLRKQEKKHGVPRETENFLMIDLIEKALLTKRRDGKLDCKIEAKQYTDQLGIFERKAQTFCDNLRKRRNIVFKGDEDRRVDNCRYNSIKNQYGLPLASIIASSNNLATRIENEFIINLQKTGELEPLRPRQWKCHLTAKEYANRINDEIRKLNPNQVRETKSIIFSATKKKGIVFREEQPVSTSSTAEPGIAPQFLRPIGAEAAGMEMGNQYGDIVQFTGSPTQRTTASSQPPVMQQFFVPEPGMYGHAVPPMQPGPDFSFQSPVFNGQEIQQANPIQLCDEQSETLESSSPLDLYQILQSLPPLEKDEHGQYQYTRIWLNRAINKGLPLRKRGVAGGVPPETENSLMIDLIQKKLLTKRWDGGLDCKIEAKQYANQLGIYGKRAFNLVADRRNRCKMVFAGDDNNCFDDFIYHSMKSQYRLPLTQLSASANRPVTKIENDFIINLWETGKLQPLGLGQWKCHLTAEEYVEEIIHEISKVQLNPVKQRKGYLIWQAKNKGIVFNEEQFVSKNSAAESGFISEFPSSIEAETADMGMGYLESGAVLETHRAPDEKIEGYGAFEGLLNPSIDKEIVRAFIEENRVALPGMGLMDIMSKLKKMRAFSFYPENDSALLTKVAELLKEMRIRYRELTEDVATTAVLSLPPAAKRARIDAAEVNAEKNTHVNTATQGKWEDNPIFDSEDTLREVNAEKNTHVNTATQDKWEDNPIFDSEDTLRAYF